MVWRDNRNGSWDIYGYDFVTRKEFQITRSIRDELGPAIYKDVVVWIDMSGRYDPFSHFDDLYGFNFARNKEFRITTDESIASAPAIYENMVVWTDLRSGKGDIYGYILPPIVSQTEGEPTEKPPETENPETNNGKEGGICTGTAFTLLLIAVMSPCLSRRGSLKPSTRTSAT